MSISKVYRPFIQPQKISLPRTLILHTKSDFYGSDIDCFTLFSLKKGSQDQVRMKCFPMLIERDGKKDVPSLYIWRLFSNCSGHGLGREMLDFAKVYSRKVGCKGNLHLYAGVGYMPNKVPHIFYRKCGMNTDDIKIDNKLDTFIAQGKDATYLDFTETAMYFPPVSHIKENKFLKAIKKFFSV